MKGMSLARFALLAAGAIALAGCGSGGSSGPTNDELQVNLGQPGPGDPQNYFPLSVGNLWQFRSTGTGLFPPTAENTVSVTGTAMVGGGVEATVVSESNPSLTGDAVGKLVKDSNGIADFTPLVDSADPAALAPYWAFHFPLSAGSEFVQLNRQHVALAEDVDGDGVNDTASVRSVVRTLGVEAVDVPAGHFGDAVRVQRIWTATLSTSSPNAGNFTTSAEDNVWLAPNVGWVKRTESSTSQFGTSTIEEVLEAYVVDGVAGNVQQAGSAVVSGSVAAGEARFWRFSAPTAGRYTASLTGLTGNADLTVASGASCIAGNVHRPGSAPEDCSFDAPAGPVIVGARGVDAAAFVLSLSASPLVTAPIDESAIIAVGVPTTGQVGAGGVSTYAATGLAPGKYTISISGSSGDAALHVYSDQTYSFELDCTLRVFVPTLPEDCTLDSAGALYFRVSAGPVNRVGASYVLLVNPAPGA